MSLENFTFLSFSSMAGEKVYFEFTTYDKFLSKVSRAADWLAEKCFALMVCLLMLS